MADTAPGDQEDHDIAASQPVAHHDKVKIVRRRYHSWKIPNSTPQILNEPASISEGRTARQKILNIIVRRLGKEGIDATAMPERFFHWCLPKDGAILTDWYCLLKNPILVTPAQLGRMFVLRESTSTTDGKPTPGTNMFYMRTLSFTPDEFLDVIQIMLDDGTIYDTVFRWENAVAEALEENGPDTPFYLRYLGITGNKSPWKRHRDDLSRQGDDQGLLGRVLQITLAKYPEIIDAALIQYFPEATVVFPDKLPQKAKQDILNLREQTLIALFGHDWLLNTQRGGRGHQFVPDLEQDEIPFLLLRTNTLEQYSSHTESCSLDTTNAVKKYALAVQRYANANINTTGTARFPFMDSLRAVVESQAMPVRLKGSAQTGVVALIGSDYRAEAFSSATPFLRGGANAADVVVEIVNFISKWDKSLDSVSQDIKARDLLNLNYLPFINIYPWTNKSPQDSGSAFGFVRQYLNATKPLITLAFGHEASSLAKGAFQQATGIQKRNLLEHVGNLYLSKFDEVASRYDDENCVIVIPSYHPGELAYGSKWQDLFLRIVAKTLGVLWLAAGEAMKLSMNSAQVGSRRKLCRQIIKSVNEKTGPDTAWGKGFKKAKEDLAEAWKNQRNWASRLRREQLAGDDDDTQEGRGKTKKRRYKLDFSGLQGALIQLESMRWKKARDDIQLILDCQRADTAPYSNERQRHAEALLYFNIDSLPPSRTENERNAFTQWVLSVPKDTQYFFACNDAVKAVEDISNLFSLFIPEKYHINPDLHNWKHHIPGLHETYQALQQWFESKVVGPYATYADAYKQGTFALTRLAVDKKPELSLYLREQVTGQFEKVVLVPPIHGSQVNVLPHSKLRGITKLSLQWMDESGNNYDLDDIPLPKECMPMFPEDTRYIFFTNHGIDIRDSRGFSLGSSLDKPVTLPLGNLLSSLQMHELQDAVVALWESETGRSVDEALFAALPSAPAGKIKVLPKAFFEGESHALENRGRIQSNVKAMQQHLPAQPCDALWLLDKFLEQEYPQGGGVDCANPTIMPTAPSVWTKLANFLSTPKYYHHPQRRDLYYMVQSANHPDNAKRIPSVIAGMLTILRGSITTRSKALGSTSRTIYTIGIDRPDGILEDVPEPDPEELDLDALETSEGWQVVDDDEEEEEEGAAGPSHPHSEMQQPMDPSAAASSQSVKRKRDDEDDGEETIESARAGKRRAAEPEKESAKTSETENADRMGHFDFLDHDSDSDDEMLLGY
ncbi:hypothetical protein LTR92_001107 [Exophiala xenobiotica]|nr:hypothetical protein LTR92_001107 [Exophiala xenobiotica]